jgi:hypothetical protein
MVKITAKMHPNLQVRGYQNYCLKSVIEFTTHDKDFELHPTHLDKIYWLSILCTLYYNKLLGKFVHIK